MDSSIPNELTVKDSQGLSFLMLNEILLWFSVRKFTHTNAKKYNSGFHSNQTLKGQI